MDKNIKTFVVFDFNKAFDVDLNLFVFLVLSQNIKTFLGRSD